MLVCPNCGFETDEEIEYCPNCRNKMEYIEDFHFDLGKNFLRFMLVFCLGFIGCFIINHTSLKPNGWKARTYLCFFLGLITMGIFQIVLSIYYLSFSESNPSNFGYIKDLNEKNNIN